MYRSIGLSFLNLIPRSSQLSIGGRYPAHIYVSIHLYSLDAALLGDSFRQSYPAELSESGGRTRRRQESVVLNALEYRQPLSQAALLLRLLKGLMKDETAFE